MIKNDIDVSSVLLDKRTEGNAHASLCCTLDEANDIVNGSQN